LRFDTFRSQTSILQHVQLQGGVEQLYGILNIDIFTLSPLDCALRCSINLGLGGDCRAEMFIAI
jgi:hypothetical protein